MPPLAARAAQPPLAAALVPPPPPRDAAPAQPLLLLPPPLRTGSIDVAANREAMDDDDEDEDDEDPEDDPLLPEEARPLYDFIPDGAWTTRPDPRFGANSSRPSRWNGGWRADAGAGRPGKSSAAARALCSAGEGSVYAEGGGDSPATVYAPIQSTFVTSAAFRLENEVPPPPPPLPPLLAAALARMEAPSVSRPPCSAVGSATARNPPPLNRSCNTWSRLRCSCAQEESVEMDGGGGEWGGGACTCYI